MKNFCPIPFETIDIRTDGTYQICCDIDFSNPASVRNNEIVKENGEKYHISKDPPAKIFNDTNYVNVRQQFLQNEKPSMCDSCWKKEAISSEPLASRRQIELAGRYEANANKDDYSAYASTMPTSNIKGLILRLGNLCNLKCRMCNPYDSSSWLDGWNDIMVKTNALSINKRNIISPTRYQQLSDINWSTIPQALDNIADISESLQYITFNGGEPTLVDAQYQLYDLLIDKGHAKNIILGITTNLTNVPRKFLAYTSAFKKVIIMASIDGFDDVNHYIRYPTRWHKVIENLQIWNNVPNVHIELKSTIQMYNICNLDVFLRWITMCENDGIEFQKIYLRVLTNPVCLNIQVLPEQLKEMAATKLQPFINLPRFQMHSDNGTACGVQNVINWMYGKDLSQYLNDFFAFTKVVDQHRNQNLLTIAPYFEPYLNIWYNYIRKLQQK
jgi:pyruvate-formate lyase-activating enzyme